MPLLVLVKTAAYTLISGVWEGGTAARSFFNLFTSVFTAIKEAAMAAPVIFTTVGSIGVALLESVVGTPSSRRLC